jgi:hypothetical protein
MATLKLSIQQCDSLLPYIGHGRQGGVKISCDMDYRSIKEAVCQFREQLTEDEWLEVVRQSNTEDEERGLLSIIDVHTMSISSLPPTEFEQLEKILKMLAETRRITLPEW